jgi:CRP-like cAMP-binding protein
MQVVDLPTGTVIAEEGDLSYEFFIVRSGTAAVSVDGESRGSLGPGDVIGEIGVLSPDLRRSATVVTTSPMTALVMSGPHFRAMLRDHPQIADRIVDTIRLRLR